jgi:hypothetical protein
LRELPCGPSQFFALARERYRMLLRRKDMDVALGGNKPYPGPWSDDPVLAAYRFCNVFREDDKTTAWFRYHVRDRYKMHPSNAIVATIAFRWFNRIETGELLLPMLRGEVDQRGLAWDSDFARTALRNVRPLVTGAYMIKTPTGMSKLEGIIWCMERLFDDGSRVISRILSGPDKALEEVHEILCTLPFLGPFMAYEVVTDLRHTNLLCRAADIDTWASPGPGCVRGASWVEFQRGDCLRRGAKRDEATLGKVMRNLMLMSTEERHWPAEWPQWEMREVEHWLCEYDKWCRATYNGQTLKRRYEC